ncbi:FG-GAP-like repeat-containing protein [Bacteroidota bacterium]
MKILNIKYIYAIAFICISLILNAQDPELILNEPITGSHPNLYEARDAVILQPDFSYEAQYSDYIHIKTDPSIVVPNEPITDPVDPSARALNTSLPVGTTAGNYSVSNGTANYTIPIFTPPGTAGMQPSISISYNSQAGFGLLGKGWNIAGISAITRTGSTIYNNDAVDGVEFAGDNFMLNGQRLIWIGSLGSYQTEYKTEHESFQRIVAWGSAGNGPSYFIVQTKDGLTIEYGNTDDSKIEAQDRSDVLIWYISKVTDPYGNYIKYYYYDDNEETGDPQGVFYPIKIEYTGNTNAGLDPYNAIEFFYETKDDNQVCYVEGSKVDKNALLYKIRVTAENKLAREYQFNYVKNNLHTFLYEVIEKNSKGEQYNSTLIDWGEYNENLNELSTNGIINSYCKVGDFNGDGKKDYVAVNTSTKQWTLYLNTDGFNFTNTATGNFGMDYEDFYIGDFNGDGMDDIVSLDVYITNKLNPYISNGSSFIELPYFIFPNTSIFEINIGDFNGDYREEIIARYGNNYKYLNYDETTSEFLISSEKSIPAITNPKLYSQINDILIDFNGDGKTDMLFLTGDGSYYYEIDENYDFIQKFSETIPSSTTEHLIFGDYNSDGKTDVLFHHSGNQWHLRTSKGNGTTGKYLTIDDFNLNDNPWFNRFYSGDFDGNGFEDIMFSGKETVNSIDVVAYHIAFSSGDDFVYESYYPQTPLTIRMNHNVYDYNGDGITDIFPVNSDNKIINLYSNRDHLFVQSVTNGLNNMVEFEYKPLTYTDNDFYSKAGSVAYPVMNIQAPIYAVSSIATNDGIGGQNVINYKYIGARMHCEGKGMLGFSTIIATNTATNIEVENNFSFNSTYYFPYITNSITRTTSGTPIVMNNYTPEVIEIDASKKIIFSYMGEIEQNKVLQNIRTISNRIYDANGNLESQVTNYDGEGSITINKDYETIDSWWIPSRVSSLETIKSRSGEPDHTNEINYSYNDDGSIDEITTDGPKPVSTIYTYNNPFGLANLITNSATGVSARTFEFDYDSKGRFVNEATNTLGHSVESSYDNVTGRLIYSIDANNNTTYYEYNGFGRLVKTILPNGNVINNIINWDQGSGLDNSLYYSLTYGDGINPIKAYFDIFGRTLRTESRGFDGSDILIDKQYNALGQLTDVSEPSFSVPDTWTTYSYDEYGRNDGIDSPTADYTITYNGRDVTTTNISVTPNQSTTKTIDAFGLLVESYDALGNDVTYEYNSLGLPREITAPGSAVTTMDYDHYGNQIELVEPNAGTFNYTYNAFGELLTQNDNGVTSTMTYDRLGRIATLTETEGTTNYTYDTKTNGKGLIAHISGPNGVSEDYNYNNLSLLSSKTETIDGINFTESFEYDQYGRLSKLTYPNSFAVNYEYNNYHYLSEVKRDDTKAMVWQANSMNQRGQIEQFTSGNNLVTNHVFDTKGFLTGITTGPSGIIQDWTYNWETETGNLLSRTDNFGELTESFQYDDLNRLTQADVDGTIYEYNYGDNGNIESSTSLGSYAYDAGLPHAVTSVDDPTGIISSTLQDVDYTSFDKVSQITEGSDVVNFTYGVDKQRRKMVKSGSTNLTRYYAHGNYERDTESAVTTHRYYIHSSTGLAAIYEDDGTTGSMYYIHKDHLGSFDVITNQAGSEVERLSFDAWGRRRDPADWDYAGIPTPTFDRGYTGHEHLDEHKIINMNGRIYDPAIGRFFSPDMFVQAPGNTQSYNRYSYCFNNPLKYTDPSGWWGGIDDDAETETKGRFKDLDGCGGYSYNWDTGQYEDGNGNIVSWGEVYNNYIVPNSSEIYYGDDAANYVAHVAIAISAKTTIWVQQTSGPGLETSDWKVAGYSSSISGNKSQWITNQNGDVLWSNNESFSFNFIIDGSNFNNGSSITGQNNENKNQNDNNWRIYDLHNNDVEGLLGVIGSFGIVGALASADLPVVGIGAFVAANLITTSITLDSYWDYQELKNPQPSDKAQLTLNLTNYVIGVFYVGWTIPSVFVGIVDLYGGFDPFYDKFDK